MVGKKTFPIPIPSLTPFTSRFFVNTRYFVNRNGGDRKLGARSVFHGCFTTRREAVKRGNGSIFPGKQAGSAPRKTGSKEGRGVHCSPVVGAESGNGAKLWNWRWRGRAECRKFHDAAGRPARPNEAKYSNSCTRCVLGRVQILFRPTFHSPRKSNSSFLYSSEPPL